MKDSFFKQLSAEEEVSFREWARENWAPGMEINEVWHPVVRDEISRMQERETEK